MDWVRTRKNDKVVHELYNCYDKVAVAYIKSGRAEGYLIDSSKKKIKAKTLTILKERLENLVSDIEENNAEIESEDFDILDEEIEMSRLDYTDIPKYGINKIRAVFANIKNLVFRLLRR
jgi:hypothetical protein